MSEFQSTNICLPNINGMVPLSWYQISKESKKDYILVDPDFLKSTLGKKILTITLVFYFLMHRGTYSQTFQFITVKMTAEHNDMDLLDLFNSSKELLYKVHRIRVMSQDIGSPWPFKINLLTNWVHNYMLSTLCISFYQASWRTY